MRSEKLEATEWPQKLFLIAHTRGKLSNFNLLIRQGLSEK